jgi:hypothetical protein
MKKKPQVSFRKRISQDRPSATCQRVLHPPATLPCRPVIHLLNWIEKQTCSARGLTVSTFPHSYRSNLREKGFTFTVLQAWVAGMTPAWSPKLADRVSR